MANVNKSRWPYPIVELFLGRRTPEATLAAARQHEEHCDAQFYVGEWHLLRADLASAIGPLKRVAETCADASWSEDARAELKRLGQ